MKPKEASLLLKSAFVCGSWDRLNWRSDLDVWYIKCDSCVGISATTALLVHTDFAVSKSLSKRKNEKLDYPCQHVVK